jgi:hypothetical protein
MIYNNDIVQAKVSFAVLPFAMIIKSAENKILVCGNVKVEISIFQKYISH